MKISKKYLTQIIREQLSKRNESIEADKIVCENCAWEWKIVDGGDDLFICHKCGHDNEPRKRPGHISYSQGPAPKDWETKNWKMFNESNQYDEYEELASELAESLTRMFSTHRDSKEGSSKMFEHKMSVSREIEGRPFEFDLEVVLGFSDEVKAVVGQGYAVAGEDEEDYVEDDTIEVTIVVNPALKRSYEVMELTLFHFLVHEMEHLVHGDGVNRITDRHVKEDPQVRSMINMGLMPPYLYKLLPREIVSGVKELQSKAKATGKTFEEVLELELDDAEITDREQRDKITTAYKKHLNKKGF